MASVDTAAQLRARRLPPLADILLWLFGAILLLAVGWFLIKNLIDSPQRFAEVSLIGFTNGSIFALIALGYTLVYGIIELINFAHGDNFMLGTFETQSIVVGRLVPDPARVRRDRASRSAPRRRRRPRPEHRLYAVFMSLIAGDAASAA